jgi:hypothetical protein
MSDFFLDAPAGWGADTAAAAYDGTVGSSVGTAITAPLIIYKRCTGICGIKIRTLGFQCTVSVAGATNPVVNVYVRPTFGVDTARRLVGAITIPAGSTVAGDVVGCTFSSDNINVNPGEEIIAEVATKGTGLGSGFITGLFSPFLVGPTSGGTVAAPLVSTKPFGTVKVGTIKLISTGQTNQ